MIVLIGIGFALPHSAARRRDAIRHEIKWSFDMYSKYAWGSDDLVPRHSRGENWLHMGNTIVDSLDTLFLSGLVHEFDRASDWIKKSLSFRHDGYVNAFEVNIRILGGLLSAYALSGRAMFLNKASDLGDRLASIFKHMPSMPHNNVNLAVQKVRHQTVFSLAQVGTLQMEFRYLAHSMNSTKYAKYAENACNVQQTLNMHLLRSKQGLLTPQVNAQGKSMGSIFTIGAEADSYYEYLLKSYLQGGGRDRCILKTYKRALSSIVRHMIRYRGESAYVISVYSHTFEPIALEMGHLECFAPAMIALSAKMSGNDRHLKIAQQLARGCWQLYNRSTTVGFESLSFHRGVRPRNPANVLRPEVAESLYVLYKVTGDEQYREWGWTMFQSFVRHSRYEHGYCSMRNARNPHCTGKMESFWIAETLKYLYLMYDDKIDLEKWVFNTEAHPFPIIREMTPCYSTDQMC